MGNAATSIRPSPSGRSRSGRRRRRSDALDEARERVPVTAGIAHVVVASVFDEDEALVRASRLSQRDASLVGNDQRVRLTVEEEKRQSAFAKLHARLEQSLVLGRVLL